MMTYMIGFSGHCAFVYVNLSIIRFFALFIMTVMTGCFKSHYLFLECMCFTMISTFNLILSATGTTGQNGRKAQGFTNLYNWSLVVLLLQLWNVLNFSFVSIYLGFLATVTTNYVGCDCQFRPYFLCFLVGVSLWER